jgi:hypothetical protein
MSDPLVQHNRRRADARSVSETGDVVKTFTLGGKHESAVYGCGCVAVDSAAASAPLQLLECPTHAALHAKLRRRQTDRV